MKDVEGYVKKYGQVNIEDDKEISIPYVIVRGSVNPKPGKTPLESQYQKGCQGVIRQFSIVEHKRTLGRAGFWIDSSRTIQNFSNHIPFVLGQTVEVSDFAQASQLDLDVTYSNFDTAPNTLSDHVWGWVVGDRSKGVQSTEEMLLINTDLTGVGELVLKNGKVRLQEPSNGNDYFLIKDTSKGLLKSLKSNSKALKTCLVVLGSVGLMIGTYAGWKYYKKWKVLRSAHHARQT